MFESLEKRQMFAYTGPDMPLLKVSDDRRHLVQDNGNPFLIVGDAAWSLVVEPDRAQVEQYLSDRAARGFNVVMVNLIEALFNGPVNAEGQSPFLDGDFNTPNEAYFGFVDYTIAKAAEKGIYVLLCPSYLGFPGTTSGWYEQLIAAGPGKAYNYGKYVGNRYKDFDNVFWLMGGDREPDDARDENSAVAYGIKEADSRHIMTAHSLVEFSGIQSYNESWLDFNSTYTYGTSYLRARGDWVDHPNYPSFLLEDKYEGEASGGNNYEWRAAKWWALTSGSEGAIMGNRPLWLFDPGWQSQLDSRLTNDMSRLGSFFRRLDWSRLQPDLADGLIGIGQGTYTLTDFVTTSISSDRTFSVSYLPTARTVSVRLSEFAQPVVAKWYDPTNGSYITATGSLNNSGSINLYPPTQNNSAGDGDWVLLFEPPAAALNPPTNLSLNVQAGPAVRVAWTDNSSDEDGFNIERRYRGGSTWESAGSVAAGVTSFVSLGVYNNVSYDFRVLARRGSNTAPSAVVSIDVGSATPVVPPVVPPAAGGTITGVVFYDYNYSTIREPGEGGTADKRLYVDLNNNRVADAGEPQAVTDVGGWCQIKSVPAGTWNIRYEIAPGFYQSFPWDDKPRTITIAAGQTIGSQDFGTMYIPTASAGALFIDRGGDGVLNGTDKLIRNVPIFADANGNKLIEQSEAVGVTDSRGRFIFSTKPMGAVLPVGMARRGFELAEAGAGVAVAFVDRNGNGRFDARKDRAIVRSQFFLDENNNGQLDAGERTFRTGAAGRFTFGEVPIDLRLIRQILI